MPHPKELRMQFSLPLFYFNNIPVSDKSHPVSFGQAELWIHIFLEQTFNICCYQTTFSQELKELRTEEGISMKTSGQIWGISLSLQIYYMSHSFKACLAKDWTYISPTLQNWLPTPSGEKRSVLLSILSSMSFQQTASYVSDLCQPIFWGFHTIIRGHRALIIIFTFHLLY